MMIGNTRPYPPTGLDTKRWKSETKLREVRIDDLTTTQDGVKLAGLLGYEWWSGDPYPHVVAWREDLYLEDGHCRVARALLMGRRIIMARVFGSD